MFQIVRVADGWQIRYPLLPIEAQLVTFISYRRAVEQMRSFVREMHQALILRTLAEIEADDAR